MPKYVGYLPAGASIRHTLTVDEPITDPAELKQRFVEDAEADGGLCWKCSQHVELGDVNVTDETPNDVEIWEE